MGIQTKIVGTSGQISLGKQYAGQHVIVEKVEPGEWRIQMAITIPKSQAWVHTQGAQAALSDALEWATKHEPKATSLTALTKKLRAVETDKTAKALRGRRK